MTAYRPGDPLGRDDSTTPSISWKAYGTDEGLVAACYVAGGLLELGPDGWAYVDTSKPEDVVRRRVSDKTIARTRASMPAGWPLLAGQEALRGAGAGAALVDDAESLLFDLLEFIVSFVALPSIEASWAAALWAAHTHFAAQLETTPRLAVVSPEPQCGKTRLLEVLQLVCARTYSAVNTSVAAMFRLVESLQPTLLFDEADTYFGARAREHEELRGLINAGHRKGAMAFRCIGDPKRMEVRAFPAFCPVALACIGDLPATIFDRAVIVRMRRRRADERVAPFRQRHAGPSGKALHDRLAAWAESAGPEVGQAEPALPEHLADRPADVWEPLIAIADAAGGIWPGWARQAALALEADRRTADVSLGIRLLADIQSVFGQEEKMATVTLLERLNALEESPWANIRGAPLDARGLARRLRRYDVSSKSVRLADAIAKGYERADFADPWARYLSLSQASVTSVTSVAAEADAALHHEADVPLVTDVTDIGARQAWREDGR